MFLQKYEAKSSKTPSKQARIRNFRQWENMRRIPENYPEKKNEEGKKKHRENHRTFWTGIETVPSREPTSLPWATSLSPFSISSESRKGRNPEAKTRLKPRRTFKLDQLSREKREKERGRELKLGEREIEMKWGMESWRKREEKDERWTPNATFIAKGGGKTWPTDATANSLSSLSHCPKP